MLPNYRDLRCADTMLANARGHHDRLFVQQRLQATLNRATLTWKVNWLLSLAFFFRVLFSNLSLSAMLRVCKKSSQHPQLPKSISILPPKSSPGLTARSLAPSRKATEPAPKGPRRSVQRSLPTAPKLLHPGPSPAAKIFPPASFACRLRRFKTISQSTSLYSYSALPSTITKASFDGASSAVSSNTGILQ